MGRARRPADTLERRAGRIGNCPAERFRAGGDIVERMGLGHAPVTSFRVNNTATDVVHDTSPLEAIVGRLPFSLEEGVGRAITWLKAAVA